MVMSGVRKLVMNLWMLEQQIALLSLKGQLYTRLLSVFWKILEMLMEPMLQSWEGLFVSHVKCHSGSNFNVLSNVLLAPLVLEIMETLNPTSALCTELG